MEFETCRLSCGLRIICAPYASDVVYCGMAVDAGTRDEMAAESGMAHFTEHLSFKGTLHRSSRQIITRMESVGGDLNAYTGKEETFYYCTLLRPHLSRAIDLLLDISLCSTYPQHEIEREVEVVLDEIESYNDSPGELIYDEFEALSFPGHPLGRNILGEADRLREIRTEDVSQFTRRNYLPSRMVLYVYGCVGLDEVARQAELSIARLGIGSRSFPAEGPVRTQPQAAVAGTEVCTEKSTHQAHVMMGTRGFSATDPRHLHLYLLNNMLGGPALSSRLNMSLRERNGLVYSVESSATAYTDTGLWSVYFGCDHHDVARCRRLVLRELARLAETPLSQRVLDAARRQLKGQIGLSYDNAESVALDMAKRYLHYGRTQTKEQLFERLDALTPDELWLTAQEVFAPERITTLIFK